MILSDIMQKALENIRGLWALNSQEGEYYSGNHLAAIVVEFGAKQAVGYGEDHQQRNCCYYKVGWAVFFPVHNDCSNPEQGRNQRFVIGEVVSKGKTCPCFAKSVLLHNGAKYITAKRK